MAAVGTLDVEGILPPLTTPFDERGELDLTALARNLERYETTGLAGYLACGSSGEAALLEAAERRRLFAAVRRATSRPLVAGVNAQSLRQAAADLERAAAEGADAALVVTPYFYKGSMSQEVLRAFYLELADGAPLPLLIYNIPQNTGVAIAPATVAELAAHERIAGIKDSSGDYAAAAEILRLVPAGFAVLVGSAAILYPSLLIGAAGGIVAAACVVPQACVALYDAVRSGDHRRARDLAQRLAPVARMVTAELGIAGLKAALDLAGYAGGAPRP
ncbi:MAG: dihydrodipicolinate synthase family protein, partial [Acidobacteria bacterium]